MNSLGTGARSPAIVILCLTPCLVGCPLPLPRTEALSASVVGVLLRSDATPMPGAEGLQADAPWLQAGVADVRARAAGGGAPRPGMLTPALGARPFPRHPPTPHNAMPGTVGLAP